MAGMDIIDCHEHLPPERFRTDLPQDIFTLFSHYTRHDLVSAGLKPKEYESLFDYDIPLAQRWQKFQPYWRAIRYGSYARAALLTAKIVYGVEDISEKTFQELSEKITAENTPGIYKRMLCNRCRIRVALTQCDRTDVGEPLVPSMPGGKVTSIKTRTQLEEVADQMGRDVPKNLDDHLALAKSYLEQLVAEGTIVIKFVSKHNLPANRKEAEYAFKRLLNGEELVPGPKDFEVLENFLVHNIIDMATELNLVVALHAGIWRDFRNLDPKFLLTLAPAHPEATFDLYHLGMPFVRDAIVIAKDLPNVYLNLCWTHIISQVQTCSGIDELLDQVPVNKILAFGGDYGRPVEKVVGHLHMARENFATIFCRRIDRELMSFDQAMEILKLWFWHNPLSLYSRLQVD